MTRPVAPQHMVTRFAPSPTGRLHVGHGWSALMAMDLARAAGGTMRLRIEDIDGTRSRPEHVAAIIEDLRWLGVAWDGEIIFQSQHLADYDAALDQLRAMDLLYPCFCTRKEIADEIARADAAPHGLEGPLYPGTCRTLSAARRAELLAEVPVVYVANTSNTHGYLSRGKLRIIEKDAAGKAVFQRTIPGPEIQQTFGFGLIAAEHAVAAIRGA